MKLETEPFRVMTGEFGLPTFSSVLSKPTGKEVISGLSSATLAKWYWMLGAVEVSYSYVVNGCKVQYKHIMDASKRKPVERALGSPKFTINKFQEDLGISTYIDLNLHNVKSEDQKTFFLDFEFHEKDEQDYFTFGLLNESEEVEPEHTLSTSLLGHKLTFALYLYDEGSVGKIDYVNFNPMFFEVKSK